MKRLPPLLRLPWARGFALLLPVLLFFGCRDADLLTAPADAPAYDIRDGANGGNRHFFFLAPLVPRRSTAAASTALLHRWSGSASGV